MKIMLIEDNPTDLKLFVELLHDAGHETVPLANADDALRVLRETGIDLILVDVLLPGTDGLAFAHQVKADEALRGIPLLVMSAFKAWPFKRLARDFGCNGFIQKPIDTRRFARQLATAAGKN